MSEDTKKTKAPEYSVNKLCNIKGLNNRERFHLNKKYYGKKNIMKDWDKILKDECLNSK